MALLLSSQRTPLLRRVQAEAADLAVLAQGLGCRLTNNRHKELAERAHAASLELARLAVAIGNASACPGFSDHFTSLQSVSHVRALLDREADETSVRLPREGRAAVTS